MRIVKITCCSLLVLLSSQLSAQLSIPEGDTISITKNALQVEDIALYFDIVNTGNVTVPVRWRMSVDEMTFPTEWEYYFCDNNSCYLPWTKECPEASPNSLNPGGTFEWILHTEHNGVLGTHFVNIEFFHTDFPDEILETLTVEVTATDQMVSNESIALSEINTLFPNPASEDVSIQLEMESAKEVSLSIFDLSGKLIGSQKYGVVASDDVIKYNVSSLSSGMYVFKLDSGEQVSAQKVSIMK